jgi:hypothetical protein
MKRLVIICITLHFCASCNAVKVDKAHVRKEVHTFLGAWHQAATDADFENYFTAMDSLSVFIGTAAEEVWTKTQFQAFSKPYFDKGKAWSFKTLERNVHVDDTGDFVWFDELIETWMGTCRGAGVLKKTGGVWRIKQYVLSVPIPNEDIQAVIAIKKKKDSLFLKKYLE